MVVMPEKFQGERLGGPLALLKLQSTRTLEYCAREAQQILGGIGVTKGGWVVAFGIGVEVLGWEDSFCFFDGFADKVPGSKRFRAVSELRPLR